ncbi:MAG: YqgE/AlgH family protein [Vicinamibacterales bacterium]
MNSLAPALLLSMPQMVDPNFTKTVVLLCRHSEEGAFGLVLNRPAIASGRVIVGGEPMFSTDREFQLWVGGPVDPQQSWMLVGHPSEEDLPEGLEIAEGLHLSTSPDLLRRLFQPDPPPRTRLMAGYSGWGPGQLEAELEASAWLLSDISTSLIFDIDPERMWDAAIRRLGADPAALHGGGGVH